ncbi:MAG: universal stress protein UspE [Gammaproteobacteria bacterium CG22_combo_CG10-13_8_21_14_all_40_8]|nr:MAG: universal stress protein UspE [Gammaproteobacteria bacterium CG22_combo_CG10-13_8_21_14_all_40_8]
MNPIQNILVVLEANSTSQPALERAKHFAEKHPCQITVRLGANSRSAEINPNSTLNFKQQLENNCLDYIHQFTQPLIDEGFNINISLGWEDNSFEGIIHHAQETQAQIIIKSSKHHNKLKSFLITPTDWHLLRKSPLPILLVHAANPLKPTKILAAVSSMTTDEEHQILDLKVIDYAKSLSEMFHANLQVINAYTMVPLGLSLDGSGFYQDEYCQDLQQQLHRKTLNLTRQFSIPDSVVETRQGEVHQVIVEFAEEQKIDLVVLGTIARQGLSGMLLGNTVEQILDDLECAVLTLKQDGFESNLV